MYTPNSYGRKQGRAIVLFSTTFTVSGVSSIFAVVSGAEHGVAWPLYASTALSVLGAADAVMKTVKLIEREEKFAKKMRQKNKTPKP